MKTKGVYLTLFLLCACACGNKPPTGHPGSKDPDVVTGLDLSVMTYNITQSSFNNTADDPHNWAKGRKERVIRIMKDYAPDLIMCQEDDPQQGSDICLALNRVMAGVSKNGLPGGNSEHNAIYYDPDKFTLLQQGHFFFSETPEEPSMSWDATFKTFCTWFKLKKAGGSQVFFVFNMHLHYGAELTRRNSVLLLKEKVSEIAGDYPVIATGDMNDNATGFVYTTFTSFLQDTYNTAYKREGPYGTYSNFDPDYDFEKYRFDYIFMSDHFKVNSYKVITDMVGGYIPSDHFPVMCAVTLKDERN